MDLPPHLTPPMLVAAGFTIVLGLPFGLYVLSTRERRRTIREIANAAEARGWRFRHRRWSGDPTAFRIAGHTGGGLPWMLSTAGTNGRQRGWFVQLMLRIPVLGGEVDFAVLPRAGGDRDLTALAGGVSENVRRRVEGFSGTLANAIDFAGHAADAKTGVPDFDALYETLILPKRFRETPVSSHLAARILHWPADAVAAHSMLAWRDPFGMHLVARLPATPNWETITYFLDLAEELCAAVPAPQTSPAPSGIADRLIARLLRA